MPMKSADFWDMMHCSLIDYVPTFQNKGEDSNFHSHCHKKLTFPFPNNVSIHIM
jgi:hypothetical protein